MIKKVIGVILVFILIAAIGVILRDTVFAPKKIHIHAGFHVYKDNKLVDFSDAKYMHAEPCTIHDDLKRVDEQGEKAHLHDFVGDVVHVHRVGATWGDLFKNIKYSVDESKTLAYVNSKEISHIFSYQIHPYDSLVLFIGKHDAVKQALSQAVSKDYIQKIEKQSESCGSGS